MKDVMDFLSAALPWISIGLLLAIFFAQNAGKKKKDEKKKNYSTEGMALGMCFGTAIGTSLGNNTGIGRMLLSAAEKYATERGAGALYASCIENRQNDSYCTAEHMKRENRYYDADCKEYGLDVVWIEKDYVETVAGICLTR